MISHKDIKFAVTVAESLNPFSYSHLRHRNVLESLSYIFSLVFACIFILSAYYVPSLISMDSRIYSELGKFERIGVSYEMGMKEPVDASFFGISILRFGDKGNSLLSISDDGISSRSVFCMALSPLCRVYRDSEMPASDMNDLSGRKKELSLLMRNAFLLALPGIFMSVLIYFVVKYIAISAFFAVLGLVFSRLMRFELNLYSSFVMSCYSITVLAIPQMLSGNFGISLFGMEWLFFLALFISGLMFSSKKGDKDGSGRGTKNK